MKRLALGLALVVALTSLAGCAADTGYTVIAKVVDDSAEVQAPALPMPKVNLDAGFSTTSASLGRPTANLSPVTTSLGLGSLVRVLRTDVTVGDRVVAGEPLLVFDDAALKLDIRSAEADADVARRQIAILDTSIQETYDKEADLDEAKVKAQDAIAKLTRLRGQLTVKLAQARATARTLPGKLRQVTTGLAQVEAGLAQLQPALAQAKAALAALPPEAPPEQRAQLEATVQALTKQVKTLTTTKATLVAARAQLVTAIATLKVAIPKLVRALGTIATGLAKAHNGLRKIASGKAKLADARTQLRGLRSVARVAADAAKTGVAISQTARGRAVVTAPVDGVVVSMPDVGTLLAPGATAAVVRPTARRLTTWLSPGQLVRSCVGDRVSVTGDWMSAPLAGTLARVGDRADYPPTSFPTDEVHLTRAVPVDLVLDTDTDLPVGVPLEVHVTPCHLAGTR